MSKEVKDFYEELIEYSNGGMSGFYPFEDTVKEFVNYIEQLQQELEEKNKIIKETIEYINFLIITTAGIQDELYNKCNLGMVRFNDTLWGKEILEILDKKEGNYE